MCFFNCNYFIVLICLLRILTCYLHCASVSLESLLLWLLSYIRSNMYHKSCFSFEDAHCWWPCKLSFSCFCFWILWNDGWSGLDALQEIFFSMVDARDGLLKGIKNAFSFVLPALDATQNWGVLDKSRHGAKFKKNFKYTIKLCLSSLDGKSFFSSSISSFDISIDNIIVIKWWSLTSFDGLSLSFLFVWQTFRWEMRALYIWPQSQILTSLNWPPLKI